jgi:hypothetical protein
LINRYNPSRLICRRLHLAAFMLLGLIRHHL